MYFLSDTLPFYWNLISTLIIFILYYQWGQKIQKPYQIWVLLNHFTAARDTEIPNIQKHLSIILLPGFEPKSMVEQELNHHKIQYPVSHLSKESMSLLYQGDEGIWWSLHSGWHTLSKQQTPLFFMLLFHRIKFCWES